MKFFLFFHFQLWALILLVLPVQSQDIKSLDYKNVFQKNRVNTRTCYEVKYTGNAATDSLLKSKEVYDIQGRLTSILEYYAGGKLLAEHHFEYDAQGKIVRCTVSHAFNEMKPAELTLKHDPKGRLVERTLPEAVRNYWQKETFLYHANGTLAKTQQWYLQNGTLAVLSTKEYPASIAPKDNSLTLLFDQKSLPIVHNFYSASGKMERAWRYVYTYR